MFIVSRERMGVGVGSRGRKVTVSAKVFGCNNWCAFQYESGYSKSSSADQYLNVLREEEDELEAVDGVLGEV